MLADRFEGRRLNSPNDLVYRSDGTLYFTDPPFGLPGGFDDPAKELPFSGVFAVRDGEVALVTDELAGPNGLAFSPDERYLYVGDWDPEHKVVMRYDVDADGAVPASCLLRHDRRARRGRDRRHQGRRRRATSTSAGPAAIWVLSPEGEHLGTLRAARGPAQPRLGRRRRPHALRHRADQRLPAAAERPGHPPATDEEHTMSKNLEPGTTSPDFELPDENGDMHRLSDLQGDDVMVLHLSRGEHCPRERQHHRELLRFHEWCSVAFTAARDDHAQRPARRLQLKIATGRALDLPRRRGPRGAAAHFDINEYTDAHHDYAAVPHTLILSPGLRDREGLRRLLVLGPPSTEQLWADLGEVLERTKADFDPTTAAAREA